MMATWNRTKIICTIGPASSEREIQQRLLSAGMDVARLNFSHGTQAAHKEMIDQFRALAKAHNHPLAILLDLQGPRLRIGRFKGGQATLEKGRLFTLTTNEISGDETIVSTTYKSIIHDLSPGDRILLSDGKIELMVKEVTGEEVRTEVIGGGVLSDHKGMNIPNVPLGVPAVTEKDLKDIEFGVAEKVDYIAVSFVRDAGDIEQVRRLIQGAGGKMRLIAKIERRQAVDNLDDIIAVSDGVMVARGDLGVELPLEEVPMVQKEIIRKANEAGIVVITATQMLASMVGNSRPTRAEVSDVANAILDGTDAIMLSEETAVGAYPDKAVLMMSRIAEKVEGHMPVCNFEETSILKRGPGYNPSGAVAEAAAHLAAQSGARWICAFTRSGETALKVSTHRPRTPILGLTPSEQSFRLMSLYWGVEPLLVPEARELASLTETLEGELKGRALVEKGDRVVIVAGFPFGSGIHSNMLVVHRVS